MQDCCLYHRLVFVLKIVWRADAQKTVKSAWVSVASLSPLASPEQKAASQAGPSTKQSVFLVLRPTCSGSSTLRALMVGEGAGSCLGSLCHHQMVMCWSPVCVPVASAVLWPAVLPRTFWAASSKAFLGQDWRMGSFGGEKSGDKLPVSVCSLKRVLEHRGCSTLPSA